MRTGPGPSVLGGTGRDELIILCAGRIDVRHFGMASVSKTEFPAIYGRVN